MILCNYCGAENHPGGEYCVECGTRLNSAPSPNSGPTSPQTLFSLTAPPPIAPTHPALIRCSQGHIYSHLYSQCPYCDGPKIDSSTIANTRFLCPYCGASVLRDDEYCGSCKKRVSTNVSTVM